MRPLAVFKAATAAALSVAILLLASTAGRTAGNNGPVVTINAVSGYAGHAFVYADVTTGSNGYPAPTGTNHQSPYYAEWLPLPVPGANCPWLWGVYVFDRASNTQINPPTTPWLRNFGTATTACPSPGSTPVAQPPMADASARLDLDLQVSVSPAVSVAGSPSTLAATLGSALTQDLNLYMNMAIEDWRVTSWFVDFGDGQSTTLNGGGSAISVPHVYQSAGQYDAQSIASISGHAQAAVYDRYGFPQLIQQGFSLQIGNQAISTTRAASVRRYLAPEGAVSVMPSLGPAGPDPSLPGFRQVDALRGRLTLLSVHLLLIREAELLVDGRLQGYGQSLLTGWRLDGTGSDAPAGTGTRPGTMHPAADLMVMQWNAPDRIDGNQARPYVIPVTLFVRTRFPDGRVASYAIATSFTVSVNFAAESG